MSGRPYARSWEQFVAGIDRNRLLREHPRSPQSQAMKAAHEAKVRHYYRIREFAEPRYLSPVELAAEVAAWNARYAARERTRRAHAAHQHRMTVKRTGEAS